MSSLKMVSPDASLVFTLQVLAAWKPCSCCRQPVLYVDEHGYTGSPFLCSGCELRRRCLALLLSSGSST